MIYLFPSFFLTLINNNWARVCELNVCAHGVLTITKKCSVETQMRESIPEPLSQGKMVWKQGRWGWSWEVVVVSVCVTLHPKDRHFKMQFSGQHDAIQKHT